jgi:dihydroorotase-like cyclic amidohydrolase
LLIVKGVLIPDGDEWKEKDIWIEGGRYVQICQPGGAIIPFEAEVLNGEKRFLFPALIDPHVHVREPGFDYKEDWGTCSRAALKGGVCAIFDMPNNKEPVIGYQQLIRKRDIALEKSLVNFGLYVALTDTNVDIIKGQEVQELICGVKIYLAETTGGLTVSSDSALLEVFGQPKHVLVHTGGPEGLERILFFYKKAQNRFGTLPVLYVCHVSTHEELKIVEREKRAFPSLHAEATPHHLLLHRNNYPECNSVLPNLADPEDAESLWEGIARGTVDVMGTDHAPHTVEEKKGEKPPSGFPGLETALPLLFSTYRERGLSLSDFLRFTSQRARALFHMGDAGISPGNRADCVLIEEGEWVVGGDGYETKCWWSPFEGWKVRYRPAVTIVNGWIAYRKGSFWNDRGEFISG